MFKVTARDQGNYKGHSGAFVTYCNISCLFVFYFLLIFFWHLQIIFYITGHILDCLKSTFITKLKE